MKNERGLTLVELLAVLAILGIIMALIGTVLINGIKASNRNATNQQLQQEANYITETIRNQYLKRTSNPIILEIDNHEHSLKMDGTIISQGYTYYDGINDQCKKEKGRRDRDGNRPRCQFILFIDTL